MRGYMAVAKAAFKESTVFRVQLGLTLISNLCYIVITFFLWDAIYKSNSATLNGMSFEHTFFYLAVASTLFTVFQTSTEWSISGAMLSGNIVLQLVRPTEYYKYMLFDRFGRMLTNLMVVTVPAMILIFSIGGIHLNFGVHLLLFPITLLAAYIINFAIDFMIGTLSFYTETVFGLSIAKEVIVSLLSGAVIPVAFFPEGLLEINKYLPFQAIYNIPLQILTGNELDLYGQLCMFGEQLLWIVLLFVAVHLLYRNAYKKLVINGG